MEPMEQRKICMLGAFGAGKTSLVSRYVNGSFNADQPGTLGVRIEKMPVLTPAGDMTLVIWDMVGANKYQSVQTSYLRQASAYLLVLDGTNADTANAAIDVHKSVQDLMGPIPYLVVVNKVDEIQDWIHQAQTPWSILQNDAIGVLETSAKTGAGVEHAFETLAHALVVTPETT
jgi:small GTP-binding protein